MSNYYNSSGYAGRNDEEMQMQNYPSAGDLLQMIEAQYDAVRLLEQQTVELQYASQNESNGGGYNFEDKTNDESFADVHREFSRKVNSVVAGIRDIRAHPDATNATMERAVSQVNTRTRTVVGDALQKLNGIKEQLIEKDVRAAQIVNPEWSNEEARDFVLKENPNQIFSQAMLDSYSKHDMETLNSLKSRNAEAKQIEREVQELVQLYQELQQMIVLQSETISNVRQDVETAAVKASEGNAQLTTAEEHVRGKNRKKRLCFLIIIIIIIIIAVVLIVYFLVVKKGNNTVTNGN